MVPGEAANLRRVLGIVFALLVAMVLIWIIHRMASPESLFNLTSSGLVAQIEVFQSTSCVAFILFLKALQIEERFRRTDEAHAQPAPSPHGEHALKAMKWFLFSTPTSIVLYLISLVVEKLVG